MHLGDWIVNLISKCIFFYLLISKNLLTIIINILQIIIIRKIENTIDQNGKKGI